MKNKKIIIMLFIMFGIIIGIFSNVEAASAGISASKTSATVGDSVSINVNINAAAWNVNVSGNGISGDSIVGYNSDGNNQSTSKSFTLNTSKAGTYTISLSGDVTDGATDQNKSVSGKVTVTVAEKAASQPVSTPVNNSSPSTPAQTSGGTTSNNTPSTTNNTASASSNANLSNLGINPCDFSGFKSNVTSYNATVPNDVTSVQVYATPQNGATYTVSGNKNLDVGTNKITVTVTAADKTTTKTYYIYVARKAAEGEEEKQIVPNVIEEKTEENGTEAEENKEKLGLLSISIEDGYEIYLEPEFKTDIYEYVINLKGDLDKVPFNAIANDNEAKVEIIGNENLQDGENTILIKVTKGEEVIEYKINVKKNMAIEEENKPEEILEEQPKEAPKNNNLVYILLGTAIIVLILVLVYIIQKTKKSKYDEDDFEEEIVDNINENEVENEGENELKENKKGKHF